MLCFSSNFRSNRREYNCRNASRFEWRIVYECALCVVSCVRFSISSCSLVSSFLRKCIHPWGSNNCGVILLLSECIELVLCKKQFRHKCLRNRILVAILSGRLIFFHWKTLRRRHSQSHSVSVYGWTLL